MIHHLRVNIIESARGGYHVLRIRRVRGSCTRCCAKKTDLHGILKSVANCPRCVGMAHEGPSCVRCADTAKEAFLTKVAEELMQ